MELLWLYFTLIATLARGIQSFIMKIFAQKETNQEVVIIYDSFFSMCFAFIGMIMFSNLNFEWIGLSNFLLLFSVGFFVSLSRKFVLQALSHLNASTYFILIRVFSSLFVVFFSMLFLQEYLSLFQWIGIFLGIGVFLLLYDSKDKIKKKANLNLGLIFLFLTILCFSYVNPIHKLLMQDIDVFMYLFYFMLSTLFFSIIFFFPKAKLEPFNIKSNSRIIYLAMLSSFLLILSISFLFKAYLLQEVGVVYKIFSFELFIPIILSMFIYKEKITLKKSLAFIGTILTILFFI